MEATVTSLTAKIGGDAAVELGPEAQAAIMKEQIRSLHEALRHVEAAEEGMPELRSEAARAALGELGEALDEARAAVDALWYLAPDDGESL